MAITKCLHMKQAKTGYPAKHLANGLRYIMNPEKTEHGRYVCGHNCIPEQALSQMVDTKRHFGKLDKRQGYHFILSFEEDEVSEEEAFQVVGEFVAEFLGKDFEAVYAVHNDTDHIHGHIIFNSVRCTTGYKYDYKNGDWENSIQPLTNRICREHGLSVLELEEVKEKRKQKGQEEKSLSERDRRIRRDVDQALQDAGSYEEFLENLSSMGYELRGRKHLSVREPGAGRGRIYRGKASAAFWTPSNPGNDRRGDTDRMDVCVYPIPGAAFDQIPEGTFSSQVPAGETNGRL